MFSHQKGKAHSRLHWGKCDQEVEGGCYPPLIIPSKAVPGVLSPVLGLSVQGAVETLKRTQEGGLQDGQGSCSTQSTGRS